MIQHSTSLAEAEAFIHGAGLSQALEELARTDPTRVYLRDRERAVTVEELNRRVDEAAAWLNERGVESSSRAAVALSVGVEHIVLIFALLRLGALWMPLNPQLKGEPLAHQLKDSAATVVVTDPSGELAGELTGTHRAEPALPAAGSDAPVLLTRGDSQISRESAQAERKDACLLMYTSGTTGPPKGALVSETMLRSAVLGALEVTTPEPGDVFYVWEPLFHIGGAQVVFLPLYREISLALVPRFSASRFWQDVVDFDVTHIHYLGGVLQILLQLPPDERERENRVRIAWGAGATSEVRAACQERFGFALHECYGMTETSSIVTVNRHQADGGVGHPLPWVDVVIRGEDAEKSGAAGSEIGELCVRGRVPGLLTQGYLANPEATEKARDGEWFRTGDRGYLDMQGRVHFTGRESDSIRVRGENVSAWQIESVFGLHPDIDLCAVIGAQADVGEQEMMLVVTAAEGGPPDLVEILRWGQEQLAKFQVPRYAKLVDQMPLTPSQRIAKHRLPHDIEQAVQLPS